MQSKSSSSSSKSSKGDDSEFDLPNPPPKSSPKRQQAEAKAEAKIEAKEVTKSKATTAVHWSTTEDGSLVARANMFVHRKIIAPAEKGGLLEYFEKHCYSFENIDVDNAADSKYSLEHYSLFQEYEAKIEELLSEFAEDEKCDPARLMRSCRNAAQLSKQADKAVQLLVASASFPKFVKLMRSKAKEMRTTSGGSSVDINCK